MVQDQVFSENDAFFAWTFVNRRPLWQTLLSFFWPVLTLAICLFPVYPHQAKLLILYSCAGVLLLIVSMLLCKFTSAHRLYFNLMINIFMYLASLMKCFYWVIGTGINKRKVRKARVVHTHITILNSGTNICSANWTCWHQHAFQYIF